MDDIFFVVSDGFYQKHCNNGGDSANSGFGRLLKKLNADPKRQVRTYSKQKENSSPSTWPRYQNWFDEEFRELTNKVYDILGKAWIYFLLDDFARDEITVVCNVWFEVLYNSFDWGSPPSGPPAYLAVYDEQAQEQYKHACVDFGYIYQKLDDMLFHSLESPLLITGGTGSGKNFFARFLAEAIQGKRIFTENLAAINDNAFREYFHGVVKGMYTDVRSQDGMYQKAKGNVLFLDELEGLSLTNQIKMLSDFETDGRVRRKQVGQETEETMRCGLIFATNRNISQAVSNGEIREDFLYRCPQIVKLDAFHDMLSANTENGDTTEYEKLILYFLFFIFKHHLPLKRYVSDSEKNIYAGLLPIDDSIWLRENPVLQKMVEYRWRGNLRQFESFCSLVIQSHDEWERPPILTLNRNIWEGWCSNQPAQDNLLTEKDPAEQAVSTPIPRNDTINRMDEDVLEAYRNLFNTALQKGGDKSSAARLLGIDPRTHKKKRSALGLDKTD